MSTVKCPYCNSEVDAIYQDKECPVCGKHVKSAKWLDAQAMSFIRYTHRTGAYDSIESHVWNGDIEEAICEIRKNRERTDEALEATIISKIAQKKQLLQKQDEAIQMTYAKHTKRCEECSAIFPGDMKQCPTCGAAHDISTTKSRHVIPVPPKPILFTKGNVKVFFIGLGMLLLSLLCLFAAPDKQEFSEDPITFLMFAVIGIIGGLMFIGVPFLYFLELRDYTQATKDYAGYVRRRTQEIERNQEKLDVYNRRTIEMQKEQERAEAERLEKLPICPICGKKDCVKRISTLNRSASIAAFGLASSKIGKQYQCERCKHLW